MLLLCIYISASPAAGGRAGLAFGSSGPHFIRYLLYRCLLVVCRFRVIIVDFGSSGHNLKTMFVICFIVICLFFIILVLIVLYYLMSVLRRHSIWIIVYYSMLDYSIWVIVYYIMLYYSTWIIVYCRGLTSWRPRASRRPRRRSRP